MSQINDFLDGNAITDAAQAAQKPQSAIDSFLDATPKRSLWTAINDNVIEVANAAAGTASAVANFVRPGNAVSQYIDKNIVEAGNAKQSDVVKAEKARYAQEMEQAQGFGDEVSATLGYVARNPLLAAAQAAGSFAGPGLAVGGVRAAAGALGMGAKAATRTGLAAGAGLGAAGAGGDAAGTAYELSRQGGATDEQALAAARGASVIPAAIGAAGGLVGAERLIAGAKGFTGGLAARALKTGAVEGAQEALEEGVTQYEGQRAAVPFNPDLDPTKGVAGAATMGAVLGGMTGGGASLLTGQNQPARKPSEDLGLNPDSGPISKVAAAAVDDGRAAAPMQPEQPAPPEDGLSLAPEEQAQPQGPTLEERLAALPEQARAQADQLLREIADERVPVGVKRFRAHELQQVLDAYPVTEKTDTITPEERAAMGPIVRGYDPATGEVPGRPLELEGERYQDGIDFTTDEQPSQSAYQDAINRIALESYQTPGQPLAMEQASRLRDAAQEQGIPATIVPHPSGKGFDVQATAALPEDARQQVAQDPVAAALPYDNSPTGRMVADAQGNARPELRPEAVGREVGWNQELAQMEADVRQSEALGMSNLRERIEAFRQKQAEVASMARRANPPAQAGAASVANTAMQPKEGQILQNRDRSTPGSIEQMQRIAAAPDYGRLGFSRDFANGAPVVTDANIDPAQLGRADIAVASDGRRIPVQYAVVEADTVLPSNRVDGSPNAEYATAADRMRAIAGNGRIAGLQAAAQRGTNAQYVQELANDTMHGINPQVIAAMRAPVLVRIMPQEQVTDDIGDVSNTTGNLQLSAVEQSRNDAQRVDLSVLEFAEDGGVTAKAVRQFVQAMPQAERGALLDVNGQPTKQAVDRLHAAVFSSAYGNDQLVRLYAQAQDPEARLILSALAKLAPKFARLEGAGALDIRPIVTQSAEIAVNARRNGTPLAQAAQQLDIAADPLVGVVLRLFAQNPRSNKLVIEKLGNAADMAYTEAFKPDADMFGPVPRATREQVMNQLEPQNEPPSTQNLEQPAGREPVPADVIGQATAGAAQPSGAATEAGTAAAAGQQDTETVAAAAPARLDHGELNIPGRTSNINAELDRYKQQQAATAKTKARQNAAETKSDKATAKELLTKHQDAIVARHGAKFGVKELKHQLDQWAKWEPKRLIAFVEKFQAEQAQANAETVALTAERQTNSKQNESENVVGQAQAATKKSPANLQEDIAPAQDVAAQGQPPAQSQQAQDGNGAMFSHSGGTDATDQTQTEAFKRWFGDSKVVDADGKPLVMYHGTSASENGDAFTYFDAYASNYGLMGQGAYFTDNPDVASSYTTKGKGSTPTVYKVFLSIQNPIDMDAKADPAKWRQQFDGIEDFHEGGDTNESWYRAAEDLLRDQGLPMWEGAETMQGGLRAMGFDGITHIGGGRVRSDGVRHRVYIAFEPTQVKSATGNNGQFDPANPDIRYSRSAKPVTNPTAVKMRRAMVQRTVDALAKGWAKAPNVTVVDNMQDERVPEAVRKADEAQRSQGAMGEPEGFWYRGQVYLVASALPTSADAARVLYHEVLGHHGLRGHFGKDLDRVLDQVIKLRRKDVQAKAQEYGLDMGNPEHAGYAAEEVLAELAQSRPDLGFVQRAIAAIRNFLRTHVPGFKVLELTDADIVQGYLLPARGWVERGGVSGAVNGDTRFSFAGERANTADTMALATAQQRLDAGEDAEIVRQETGWHKGADDKLRFEISDADAKYIGKEAMEQAAENDPYKMAEMRLDEVLDHPALFAAYPGLRDVSVAYEASSAADGDLYYGASYNAQDNVITIGNGLDEGAQLSALLHEIQHGIQNVEGFATGGGLETAKADVLEGLRTQLYFWANVYGLRREMDAKGITAQEAAAAEAEFTGEEPNADAVQIASDPELQTAVAEQNMQRLEQEIARIRKKGARGVYEAMAGEVEARNTQARQGMTDAQRRATPPSQTADVADSDVIVAFNGKEADSAPAPANAGVRFSRSGSPDAEVQRQFKETERAYGGKAAYDRAKATGKTKLTYGQWVQVRTPNFKAWFGDWEAVRAQERLDAMEPVQVRVPDAWRGLGHAELRQKMAEELDRMVREKVEINHPELGMIRVGRAGAKKSEGSARDPAKSLVAGDIEALLPVSIYGRSKPSHGGDGKNIDGYSTLLANVQIDGMPLVATFTIRHQHDGHWYYNAVTLEDGKNKKPRDSYGRPARQDDVSGFAPIAGLGEFSRKSLARVNPEAVSKVVDSATGEPLVVYHGTGADFSVFDGKKRGSHTREVDARKGFFLSSSPEIASEYAEEAGANGGANIMPAYVSLQNPLVIDEGGRDYDAERFRDYIDQAQEQGHDGVLLRNTGDGMFKNGRTGDTVIAFRSEQIKSATGNNGNFDAASPDIRFSRSAAPSLSEVAETGRDTAWTGPAASKWDDFIYKMQDKHIDTKRALEAVRETGKAVSDELDVYLQEELYHGRAAKRTEDFVKQELEPLLQYMSSAGLKMADVEEYLHARHAKEANAVIAQRNPSLPDGGSGMTNAEADAVLGAYAPMRLKLLEKAAAKVDAIIAGTRNTFVEYGLESQDVVDGWAKSFAHYVPLMREQEGDGMAGLGTGQGFSVKGKEVKGRTGSTKKVVDILANIAMQRERAIVRGEKNRVAAALVGLAKAHPSDFWKVDVVPTRQVLGKDGMVKSEHDPLYKQRDNVVVAKIPELDAKTGKVLVKEHAVLFNENDARALRMAQALKNLDAAQLEGMLGATAKVTRYLAAINTQYNPIFGITNLARDLQGAAINLQSTALAGRQGEVLTQALPALRGIYAEMRSQRKGSTTGTLWSKLWEEFQEVGGQTGYRDQFRTSADRGQAIERALDPSSWAETNWGRFFTAGGRLKVPLEMVRKSMAPVLNWLDDYNTAMENGVRLAAYKAGLDAGLSKERAASIAKNLTTNFNRKGQMAQQVGALYAFFNASMQGTARIGEALFTMEPGQPKTLRLSALGRKVVSGGVLLGAGQALMLAAAGFGDDEPPEHVRERNLVIPLGDKRYVTIPLPLGLHVLPNLGRIPAEFALGGFENPAEQVLKVAGLFADAFNPIGNSGLSAQTIAPTVLDPWVALTENRDFAGREIAKKSFNPITPGHALARDTATAHAKLIAEAVNFLSGGTAHVRGAHSPTPDQIDYLIGQFTGGVGRELSKLQQSVVGAVQGDDVPAHKVPVLGRFYGDANSPSAKQAAFYNHLDSIARHAEQVKGLRLEGEAQAANAYLQEHPEARLALAAKATSRAIQKMREQRRELEQQGAAREQVRQIEEQMTARMEQFNAQVERAMQ